MKILIVDDDASNRTLLAAIIENINDSENYEIEFAEGGHEAIKKTNIPPYPDVVLLDIMMPDIDGYEVCKTIKSNELTKHIPIIFITARNQYEDEIKAFKLGAAEYITKPFVKGVVVNRIKNQLELKKYRDNLEKVISEKNMSLININKNLQNEIRELESKLLYAQKLESLGIIARGIAHDFNNLLFPISGHAEIILDEVPNNELVKQSVKEILKVIDRTKEIVQQILKYGKKSYGKLVSFNIVQSISQTLKLIPIPLNIKIKLNMPQQIIMIKGNPIQIQQVLINLFTNAIYAMRKNGGILEVTLINEYSSNLRQIVDSSDDEPKGEYIKLSISDTGEGIDKSILDKIFEPYFTTKPEGEGSGIGLSVVQKIIKESKGYINVQSEVNIGTTFNIYLPIA
ncbi:MAG: response regulator [Desulfobacterales bacterium]|nr:response regulator [Desulfobacterales bacterium]